MDLDIKQHLPPDFDADSKVWIYQSSRLFLVSEVLEMEVLLNEFVSSWNSHGAAVKGFASIFFGRFIILIADEKATGVSGCSTDSSVRLIKKLEKIFDVDMFNRQVLAFIIKDKIEAIPLAQLKYAVENDFINGNTLYFDNTVLTKHHLETHWIVAAKNSWLEKYFEKTSEAIG